MYTGTLLELAKATVIHVVDDVENSDGTFTQKTFRKNPDFAKFGADSYKVEFSTTYEDIAKITDKSKVQDIFKILKVKIFDDESVEQKIEKLDFRFVTLLANTISAFLQS